MYIPVTRWQSWKLPMVVKFPSSSIAIHELAAIQTKSVCISFPKRLACRIISLISLWEIPNSLEHIFAYVQNCAAFVLNILMASSWSPSHHLITHSIQGLISSPSNLVYKHVACQLIDASEMCVLKRQRQRQLLTCGQSVANRILLGATRSSSLAMSSTSPIFLLNR